VDKRALWDSNSKHVRVGFKPSSSERTAVAEPHRVPRTPRRRRRRSFSLPAALRVFRRGQRRPDQPPRFSHSARAPWARSGGLVARGEGLPEGLRGGSRGSVRGRGGGAGAGGSGGRVTPADFRWNGFLAKRPVGWLTTELEVGRRGRGSRSGAWRGSVAASRRAGRRRGDSRSAVRGERRGGGQEFGRCAILDAGTRRGLRAADCSAAAATTSDATWEWATQWRRIQTP